MDYSRTKKMKLNIVFSLLSQAVTVVCGLIVPRVMLGAFGSEAYGAVASITQFLSYITLLEGGIGGVARAALFKPLADKNKVEIAKVYNEVRRFFKGLAMAFLVYVLVIATTFNKFSNVECFDWLSSFLLVIILSISSFAQYYIGITNSILLQAAQKQYITTSVGIAGTILNAILIFVLAKIGYNIHIIKLASSIVFMLKPFALWLYVKRDYNLPKISERNKKALEQKWSGLGQHLAYTVHSNTDIAVLTIFKSLKLVSVYSVYYMIVSNIKSFTTSFATGFESLMGDMNAKGEKEKLLSAFSKYETLISMVSNTFFGTCEVVIVQFVLLYTSNTNDANYKTPYFAFLLILATVLETWDKPYSAAIYAAGHYRQTRVGAYGEAIINIVSSVILVIKFGLIGVAIGTILATIFRFVYNAMYLRSNIICRDISFFVTRQIVNIVNILVIIIPGYLVISNVKITNFLIWILCSILVTLYSGLVTIAFQLIFYRCDLAEIVETMPISRRLKSKIVRIIIKN